MGAGGRLRRIKPMGEEEIARGREGGREMVRGWRGGGKGGKQSAV